MKEIRKDLEGKTVAEIYAIAAAMGVHANTLFRLRKIESRKPHAATMEKIEAYYARR